jgi:transposase-like protein
MRPVKMADLARKHGVSEATLYNWKAKFGGMDARWRIVASNTRCQTTAASKSIGEEDARDGAKAVGKIESVIPAKEGPFTDLSTQINSSGRN